LKVVERKKQKDESSEEREVVKEKEERDQVKGGLLGRVLATDRGCPFTSNQPFGSV